jgi:outer membrane protein TolC
MKQRLLILAVLLASVHVKAAGPTTGPATQPVDPAITGFLKRIEPAGGDDELRQKLKERHNTAVRLLELRLESYRRGIDDMSKVFEAARLVADAKSELVQSEDEREALLRQVLQISKDFEARLEKQFKGGVGSAADLERARLARETAEIQLLKLGRGRGDTAATQPR